MKFRTESRVLGLVVFLMHRFIGVSPRPALPDFKQALAELVSSRAQQLDKSIGRVFNMSRADGFKLARTTAVDQALPEVGPSSWMSQPIIALPQQLQEFPQV